jgi:transposase
MEFLHEGNCKPEKEMCIEILRRLRDGVRRKRPQKWRTNSWFLLHENAPAHRSVLVKDFLANNNVTTTEHPPYSPDLPSHDFYLFPRLKSALKGRRFYDGTYIIRNATKELKRLSQICFQECFQHLYSRWQKCIVAQGDYLKETFLKWLHWLVFLRNSDSGNILKLISKTLALPIMQPTMYKICGSQNCLVPTYIGSLAILREITLGVI